MKKLFLDDVRDPPDSSWTVVRSYEQFVEHIDTFGCPDVISFDHDLSFEHYPLGEQNPTEEVPYATYKEKTGLHCVRWLFQNNYRPKVCSVHSLNIVGKANIHAELKDAGYVQGERDVWKLKGL